MKFWILLLACSLLIGCFASRQKSYGNNSILAKKWTYEYYLEWGIRRVVGESLFQDGKDVSEEDIIYLLNNNSFCYNMVTGLRGSYAERLFVNENGELSLECLGLANDPFYYEDNDTLASVLNDKAGTRREYKGENVYSLTIHADPKDLEGYKPLKLDPAILPLESPGYKRLREYEMSLGKRF